MAENTDLLTTLDTDATDATAEVAATPTKPDGIPDSVWDAKKNTVKVDALKGAFGELDSLRTFKADADKASAAIPKDEAAYKIELPPNFEIPEGQTFQVDENLPLAKQVRTLAAKHKLSQDTVTDLVGMYMQIVADDMKAAAAVRAEVPEVRFEAVVKWLQSPAFENDDQRNTLAALLGSKQGFATLERIQKLLTGVSGAGHSGTVAKPKVVDITGKTAMQIFEAANN